MTTCELKHDLIFAFILSHPFFFIISAFYGEDVGAGAEVGAGEDSVEVDGAAVGEGVLLLPDDELLELESDIQYPPLSDIQWDPDGQDPLDEEVEEVDVLDPEAPSAMHHPAPSDIQ